MSKQTKQAEPVVVVANNSADHSYRGHATDSIIASLLASGRVLNVADVAKAFNGNIGSSHPFVAAVVEQYGKLPTGAKLTADRIAADVRYTLFGTAKQASAVELSKRVVCDGNVVRTMAPRATKLAKPGAQLAAAELAKLTAPSKPSRARKPSA